MHNQDIARYIRPTVPHGRSPNTAVGQTTHLTSQQPLNLATLETCH
jgi:hypothetical protein